MFKKPIKLTMSVAIVLAMFISTIPVAANTNEWEQNGFHFAYIRNEMTIIDYTGARGNITIPSRAPNNSWVYVIGERAFEGADITTVNFQANSRIHTIERAAFRRSNVSTINLPSSLETIAIEAFDDARLTRITIPASVQFIDDIAFRDNPLREAHFEHLDGRDIWLGNNVFNRAASDFRITHRRQASNFGRNWYPPHPVYAVDSVNVNVSDDDWRWTTLAGNNIMITGIHFDSPLFDATRIEIPSHIGGRTVRRIQNRAFDNLPQLEEVVIPDTIVAIYPRAFDGNRWLRAAHFRHNDGDTVELASNAFAGSHHSFTIYFPYGARGFTTPTWQGFPTRPEDVEGVWDFMPLGGGIEMMLTRYNGNATVVEVPSFIDGRPVRYISSETFRDNNNITEIIIPDTVVHISANAVFNLSNLRVVRLRHMHADTLDLSGHAFSGMHRDFTIIFPADATGFTTPTWVGFPAEPDLISANWAYTVSGGVAAIDEYKGNEEIVEIPEYIGGSPVRSIATGAFRDNDTIQRVIIPAGINRIETNAFHNCINLYAAQLLHTNANQLNNFARDSFVGVAPHFRIIVPADARGFTNPWNGYFTEPETDDLTIREGNFEFIIRREAAPGMAGATRDVVIITRYLGAEQEVTIPSTLGGFPVVGLGDFAFLQNHGVRRVIIPDTVINFGHSTFLGATNLESARFLHTNGTGIELHAATFRYTAATFTILYPPLSVGFSTPTWQGWPARPYTGAPGTPTIPGTPGIPGNLLNPHILTTRTLNSHDPHMTRDHIVLQPPIFRLEPFAPNPQFSTSYVMTRVIADILGLETSFNDLTRTATFSGYNAQNQFIVMDLVINSATMTVNGVQREVRASAGVVPAIVRDDRIFVPVRVFEDVFGVTVRWNDANRTITVNP